MYVYSSIQLSEKQYMERERRENEEQKKRERRKKVSVNKNIYIFTIGYNRYYWKHMLNFEKNQSVIPVALIVNYLQTFYGLKYF